MIAGCPSARIDVDDMDESLERCVKSLEENTEDVRDEARRALLTICRNVLRSPSNYRSRELRLDDEVVVEKLLPAVGALECLFDVGYVEDGERIFLPQNVSLLKIQSLSRMLCTATGSPITDDIDKRSTAQKAFFDKIVGHFRGVMHYEDPNLQRKAKSVVPVGRLEIATMTKMRDLQKSLKLDNAEAAASSQFEGELIAKDLFLVELLRWFKHEFFEWVNSPKCPTCSTECTYEDAIQSSDPHCSRIELHRCQKCNIVVEFPRYTHPEPLLTLRRGRCGEWADVFTLLCRSLGYDARFICDETDHVWTEIWSASNKRWVHVDPCENVIDKPLMYERGWQKKLTYVIAYSRDEVQDVTWRYTRDQEAVMKRRKACAEQTLMHLLESLSHQRQSSAGYSRARREYIVKRKLLELADMLYIPNSQDKESDEETYEGRTSGSVMWRLARGEITPQVDTEKNYIWDISKYGETFELQYNIVKDQYRVTRDASTVLEEKSGWLEGMNATEGGIFRKAENDWKMVYLARSPQAKRGRVKWTLEVANSASRLEEFSLRAKSEVFQGATVSWEIEAVFDDRTVVIAVPDCGNFRTEEVRGAVRLNVIVTLSGGQGELAWQHAQLFRQSLNDTEEPSMLISVRRSPLCSRSS
ncbi:PREDICTED: peptide-N(4)-(N-acetyl-beta-glucosaminyl)asparagine amidase [Wasmannia auropunctata]|uniref:peptide-N(4)-(N-acetyl-beta- glucosaminyl)asparagine amidase n=1 Tax=Wasmannia auropunctata TaxID=64793 RepID=UPI0005ED86B1|nr:PREDICTED: peptide-N(4)-(N-acetyl-beta-glucosaminyl)asparagine amidase [Wasmannia auropunctata]XP_011696005.1 PREDICTED: peptide-N(4)-(N-acetyl-beta-glucosaminyl)asparagine amidase [Wasmannia auropunctata]